MKNFQNMNNATLFILNYLSQNTDMNHPVTSVDLQKILEQNGLSGDSRAIRRRITMLRENGYDIQVNVRNGVPTEYYYDMEDWEKPELRILIDAVASAQFLSQQKTNLLIEKLAALAGSQSVTELTPQVCVSAHVKAKNESILINLDRVSEAIRLRKKISFRMINYNTDKQKIFRHDGEVYLLSPYSTVWKEDRYYVVGWSDKRECIVQHRLDRMEIPEVLEEDAHPVPSDYNIQDYTDNITKMYGGSVMLVTLRCHKHLIDNIIDKFGESVIISNITETSFDATAKASVSGTFLSWVFQYAGEMVILSPEPVRKMYREMAAKVIQGIDAGEDCSVEEIKWKL